MKFLITVLLILIVLFQITRSQTATAPASGTGTSGDPYLIATLDNLYWIYASTTRWSLHYRQTQDIDASATSGWNSSSGWASIGNASTTFTGSYNGDGHTISSLTINRPSNSYIGLFGVIENATITNLGVINVSISGNTYVGALVGYSLLSTVSNCYSTGTVSGPLNAYSIGGLAGYNYNGTVTSCYSTASVYGDYSGGGLVGVNELGIIGNCYSRGSVTGISYNGGLVGDNSNNGHIYNSYSTGSVSLSSSPAGGFVGSSPASNLYVNACFWDTETSGQSESGLPNGTNGASGKSTYQMTTGAQNLSNFYIGALWDFKGESANGTDDIWNINNTRNNGYPFLSWQFPSDPPLPVELTSFTANVNGPQVILNWQTATEVNNYGFDIERLEVSDQQSVNWEKIGFVAGAGNSNSEKEYSFTDKLNHTSINSYHNAIRYRLKQIDNDGSFTYSKEAEIQNRLPSDFSLYQNYPNPFNPSTGIVFDLPSGNRVEIKVYNPSGDEVAAITDEYRPAGRHSVTFDGSHLASGIYFCRITSGNFTKTIKMSLLK